MDISSSLSAEDLDEPKRSLVGSVVSRVSGFFRRTPSAPTEPPQKAHSAQIRGSGSERELQPAEQALEVERTQVQYVVLPQRLLNAYYEYRAFNESAQTNSERVQADLEKRLEQINELNDSLVRTAQSLRDAYLQEPNTSTTIVAPRLKPQAEAPIPVEAEPPKLNKLSGRQEESAIPEAKAPAMQITSIASKQSPPVEEVTIAEENEEAPTVAATAPKFTFGTGVATQPSAEPPKFTFNEPSTQPSSLPGGSEKASIDTESNEPDQMAKPSAPEFNFGSQDRPTFTFGTQAAKPADGDAGQFKFSFNFGGNKQQ